jgi:hypothetical protein
MKVCISLRLPDWCHKSRTRTTGSDSVRSNLAGRLSEALARLPLPLPACHLLSFAFALPARRSCCQAMSLVSQFVSHASQVFSAGSAPNLLASIPLDPSHPFYNPLHQALVSVRPIRSSLRGSEVQRFRGLMNIGTRIPAIRTELRRTMLGCHQGCQGDLCELCCGGIEVRQRRE